MDDSKPTRIIIWLRNDLRMKDNYAFYEAIKTPGSKEIIPMFCFDPRIYDKI